MTYFVSYAYTMHNGSFGFGNMDFKVDRPTVMIEDIRGMERHIKTEQDFKHVVIISWRKFDEMNDGEESP